MGKAIPCKRCKTDNALRWKHYNREWWVIGCDRCGAVGPQGESPREAGEGWNKQQTESTED